MKKYNFAIIGVAGYIASRHLEAIQKLNHNLLISFDKNDTVGILDKYFPNTLFYNKIFEFKKKFIFLKKKINYTVILTPNYTHFSYIKFALSHGSNVICEKPLVISKHHLKQIELLEKKYKRNVYTILQLRTLAKIKKIKKEIQESNKFNKVIINYITPRGHWYQKSWKGDKKKSGGILFNIGIHLLDLTIYLFGDYLKYKKIINNNKLFKGELIFKNAQVIFNLSTSLEVFKKYKKKNIIRDFIINNKKLDLSKTFEKAHLNNYKAILQNKSQKTKFDLASVKKAIGLALDLKK